MPYLTSRELDAKRRYQKSAKGRKTASVYRNHYYHDVQKHRPGFKEKRHLAYKRFRYSTLYGLTPEQVDAMKAEGCSLCRAVEGKMNIDHDHKTGKVRGVLCNPCNLMIGWLERAEDHMEKIRDYLGRPYAL